MACWQAFDAASHRRHGTAPA